MNKKITISLPLSVQVTKKKRWILNLNNFRNTHFRTLSKAKNTYTDVVCAIAPNINYKIIKCKIKYEYHHGTARRYDTANPCSVIDKFTCDALTHKGYWKDDDSNTISEISYESMAIDRDNPRCDMVITVLKSKKK